MIRKAFRFLRKLIVLKICLAIVLGLVYLGSVQYKRHVPVELEGSCIIFDINTGLQDRETKLIAGIIQENDFKEGKMTVVANFMGFGIPIDVDYKSVRDKGYIRINCEEI